MANKIYVLCGMDNTLPVLIEAFENEADALKEQEARETWEKGYSSHAYNFHYDWYSVIEVPLTKSTY